MTKYMKLSDLFWGLFMGLGLITALCLATPDAEEKMTDRGCSQSSNWIECVAKDIQNE